MEEGSRIGLTNRLPGHKADSERDKRENHQGNRQPSRIRPAGLLETEPLAHAYPPLRHRALSSPPRILRIAATVEAEPCAHDPILQVEVGRSQHRTPRTALSIGGRPRPGRATGAALSGPRAHLFAPVRS